jgi:hypothetical protein
MGRMFNDVFWFSMIVAAFGSTALVAVGIAFPASPAPSPDRPAGYRRARFSQPAH